MITGVIIAGGKSNRIGQDKGLLIFKGKILVQYGIDFLHSLGCSIVINSNNLKYEQFGYPIVPDKVLNIGPMGGIYSVLSEIKKDILCIPCDMPYFNPTLAALMINSLHKYDCIVPQHPDGKLEPLFACYSVKMLPIFHDFLTGENFKMQELIKASNAKYVNILNTEANSPFKDFLNLNTLEDFKRYE